MGEGLYTKLWKAFTKDFNGLIFNYSVHMAGTLSIIMNYFGVEYNFDNFMSVEKENTVDGNLISQINKRTADKIITMDYYKEGDYAKTS